MAFHNCLRAALLAPLAASAAAPATETAQHNLILLVPEILSPVTVDMGTAPSLTRLRAEGVYFINSHKGFPTLTESADGMPASNLDTELLIETAPVHSVGYIQHSGDSDRDITQLLTEDRGNTPFLIIYRISVNAVAPEARKGAPVSTSSNSDPSVEDPVSLLTLVAADEALALIEETLKELDLYDTTNIVVAAEHGFSKVWKDSTTSTSLEVLSGPMKSRRLPPGFLSIDLTAALQKQDAGVALFDPRIRPKYVDWERGKHPKYGDGIIAVDPSNPRLVVAANGDHDLIFLPKHEPKKELKHLAQLVVNELASQDYVSGIFVNDRRLGRMPGALTLSDIEWDYSSGGKTPDIVVSFVSVALDCDRPIACTAMIADTPHKEGAVLPGSFSRADTWNFMAARGPDFRSRHISSVPASNPDIVRTILEVLGVKAVADKKRSGRVLTESLIRGEGQRLPRVRKRVVASKPAAVNGLITELHLQVVGSSKYFVAAGSPGWAVGVPARPEPIEWRPWRWDWPKPRSLSIDISPD